MASEWQARVSSIKKIDDVSKLLNVWGLYSPREYADAVDGNAGKFARRAKKLKALKQNYDDFLAGIDRGVKGLDEHWQGESSDAYIQEMIPSIKWHLKDRSQKCEQQRKVADKISKKIPEVQDELFPKLKTYVQATLDAIDVVQSSTRFGPYVTGGAVILADAGLIYAANVCLGVVQKLESCYQNCGHRLPALIPLPPLDSAANRGEGLGDDDVNKTGWHA